MPDRHFAKDCAGTGPRFDRAFDEVILRDLRGGGVAKFQAGDLNFRTKGSGDSFNTPVPHQKTRNDDMIEAVPGCKSLVKMEAVEIADCSAKAHDIYLGWMLFEFCQRIAFGDISNPGFQTGIVFVHSVRALSARRLEFGNP